MSGMLEHTAYMRRVVTATTRQLVQDAASSNSVLADLITTANPTAATALDGAGNNSSDSTNPNYANNRGGSDPSACAILLRLCLMVS